MQGLDQILGSSGMDLSGLGARFGLSPEQTQSAMGSLMPAILGGVHKQVQAGSADAVSDAGANMADPDTGAGNNVLGQIFGSKDVSRQVADHAAEQTGLSGTVMRAMLPMVAAMVAKHMATQGGGAIGGGAMGGGGMGGARGGLLGSLTGGGDTSGMGNLGGLLGGGGNPLDAILAGRR